jgi:hypothetical protein
MIGRILFVVGLVLAGCGDSEDDAGGTTAESLAATGDYCCYENGVATEASAAACAAHAKSCVWSQTYSDANAAGRGTVCGYLACR